MNPKLYPEYEKLCRRFATEELCERALYLAKWPQGYSCPKCAHSQHYTIRTRRLHLYECKACGHQATVILGTILEGSRTTLRQWCHAMILHSLGCAYSATKIADLIGVTYKTAWLICHKIRHAMGNAEDSKLLTGIVHMKMYKYRRPNITRCHDDQIWHQTLLIGAALDDNERPLQVKVKKVADEHCGRYCVLPAGVAKFISLNVNTVDASVQCDPHFFVKSYREIYPLFPIHKEARHWINGAFWGGIGEKHLQAYLNQFCFVKNLKLQQAPIFSGLLHSCATTPTMTYPVLIQRRRISARFFAAHRTTAIPHLAV